MIRAYATYIQFTVDDTWNIELYKALIDALIMYVVFFCLFFFLRHKFSDILFVLKMSM